MKWTESRGHRAPAAYFSAGDTARIVLVYYGFTKLKFYNIPRFPDPTLLKEPSEALPPFFRALPGGSGGRRASKYLELTRSCTQR